MRLINTLENGYILLGPHLDQMMLQLNGDGPFVGHLPQGVREVLDTEDYGQRRYVLDGGRVSFAVLKYK